LLILVSSTNGLKYTQQAFQSISLFYIESKISHMNNLFRGLLAGYGASKIGGGCLGTVLVFFLLWMLLGQCN